MIKGDLHCSGKVVADFQKKVPSLCKALLKADYPIKFISSVINEFFNETKGTKDS